MSARSYIRGHEVVWVGFQWVYADNLELATNERPCIRCGRTPTDEGHDACLGTIVNSKSACCGHGIEKGFVL